jgi:hypothetical protein
VGVAAGVFFTVTVFVLILGLFGFINMAGGGASRKSKCKGFAGGRLLGQGVYR